MGVCIDIQSYMIYDTHHRSCAVSPPQYLQVYVLLRLDPFPCSTIYVAIVVVIGVCTIKQIDK